MQKDTTLLGAIMFTVRALKYSHLNINRTITSVSHAICPKQRSRNAYYGGSATNRGINEDFFFCNSEQSQ
jgi:hypothetical protein